MKRYGIITHYDVHNHGALLQLTALIRILKQKGIEAKALQFDKNYDFMGREMKAKYDISTKSISIYLKYFREKGLKCLKYNYSKHSTLNYYRKREALIGQYYTKSPQLDGVIIGSDEVFALHTGPTPVFFGYCLPTEHVVSYAGSFGPTTIDDIERLHASTFVKSGIENMDAVTVRDSNSADIIEVLTGSRPSIVVDPVILYGFKEEIANLSKPTNDKYLLVYSYDNRMNEPEEVDVIWRYARSKGLKIISPGFFHKWCDKCIDVDPVNLLAWFRYAEEVITDTFHGCVMAIITNVKFAVKTRENNHFKLSNLLNEYNLSERIFTSWADIKGAMIPEINYGKVNVEIEKRRSESISHLLKMIGQ